MPIDNEIRLIIRKYSIKNAIDYGKANEGAVLNKVISLHPELKSDIKSLAMEVKKEVAEINAAGIEKLKKEYSKHAEEFKAAEAEKAERSAKHDFSIEGAEKSKFVTRFPPEPGGYMHIGHAKPVFIEDELRNAYQGKLYLYFDDTNPDKESQEFVDAFKDDLKWLGIKFDKEYYASDSIQALYGYAADAIKKGKAYVCTCSPEKVKENRAEGMECEHKRQSKDKNAELWKKMLEGDFADSEAILRFNSDMKALNTTMRDPTLFRIKHAPHYRQGMKYYVWPNYDFCTPIMDSINGITDVLRSKEYEMRDELYFAVLDVLGLRKPRITSFSRLEIANNLTSKREIRELIAKNLVDGYGDPRLVTIRGLRRRGITAQAIKELALSSGIGKSESTVDMEMLLNMNRKIVDKSAKRLFFIADPVALHVEGLDGNKKEIMLKMHPAADLGYRKYKPEKELYIDPFDAKKLEHGARARLKEAYNITIAKITSSKIDASYAGSDNSDAQKVIWMNKAESKKCELWDIGPLMLNGAFNKSSMIKKDGYAEGYAANLEEGDIVQFERHGFYKLDSKKDMRFISL